MGDWKPMTGPLRDPGHDKRTLVAERMPWSGKVLSQRPRPILMAESSKHVQFVSVPRYGSRPFEGLAGNEQPGC